MSGDEDGPAELRRQFEAVTSGADLDDLRALTAGLGPPGRGSTGRVPRPPRVELRRPPLPSLQRFGVRVELRHSDPLIWRRLEVRSDLRLDVVHQVLQAAFAWMDYHLWRFSLGRDGLDRPCQEFLCPWDEPDDEPEGPEAVLASAVRLDEVMQRPGDVLHYNYDYGDNWELTVCLDEVSPASRDTPLAVAVDGRRAPPPEDCGSRRTAEQLAEVLEDVTRFDLGELNRALQSPFMVLTASGVDPRLVNLVHRLGHSPIGEELTRRALSLLTDPGPLDDDELRRCLRAYTCFLDRAAEGPIPLTAAGYLRPVDVRAVANVLPTMGGWIGAANREIDTVPVSVFRDLMQNFGLLRKYKGALKLTRAGASAQSAPEQLWKTLADELTQPGDDFDAQATLLVLVYAATSVGEELPLDQVAAGLSHLGWRGNRVHPITDSNLYWLSAVLALPTVADTLSDGLGRWRVSPVAARLARAALWPGPRHRADH